MSQIQLYLWAPGGGLIGATGGKGPGGSTWVPSGRIVNGGTDPILT